MLFYINFISGTVHLIHGKSIVTFLHFSVDYNWSGLTQALSGQFCASLNFIDSKTTTSPKLSFRREGVAFNGDHLNSSLLRHAALAREIVCTENLTPWKKLLPCDSKVHFSILFKTIYLFAWKQVLQYVVFWDSLEGIVDNLDSQLTCLCLKNCVL